LTSDSTVIFAGFRERPVNGVEHVAVAVLCAVGGEAIERATGNLAKPVGCVASGDPRLRRIAKRRDGAIEFVRHVASLPDRPF
jgi:hypothetical protein